MTDMMMFPDTWEEFEEQYGFTDREEIYTNGARLIPSFRVKQWLDHIAYRKDEPFGKDINVRSKTEPQTNGYQTFNGTSVYVSRLEDEPQTDEEWYTFRDEQEYSDRWERSE